MHIVFLSFVPFIDFIHFSSGKDKNAVGVILKCVFLLSYTALRFHHSSTIPELCCQAAMVRPTADLLSTTGMLRIGQEQEWEEGGVWT